MCLHEPSFVHVTLVSPVSVALVLMTQSAAGGSVAEGLVELCGARWSLVKLGKARWSLVKLGGARWSLVKLSGSR